jgi:putative hydrolase of the HAD superfamily
MNTYPAAILFDLDDTLISFDGVSDIAWDKCCGDFVEINSTPFSKEDLLRMLQIKRKWYWSDPQRHKTGRENIKQARRDIALLTLTDLGIAEPDLINKLADTYSDYQYELICLQPNTTDTLNRLKTKGVRMGLITNGTSNGQREKLRRFSLADYFEIILIDQELGFGKPDVRVYRHALEFLRIRPQDAWMVGDNLIWDVQAPQSCGIYSIWYDYRKNGLPEDTTIIPDRIIVDISELIY